MQIVQENYRPLIITGILVASKFFEDINFWNIDFVEVSQIYSLKSINMLESFFLSLLDFKTFVSWKDFLVTLMQV